MNTTVYHLQGGYDIQKKMTNIYVSQQTMQWGSIQWKGHVAKSKVWQEHMQSLYFSPVVKALHVCDYSAGFPDNAGAVS